MFLTGFPTKDNTIVVVVQVGLTTNPVRGAVKIKNIGNVKTFG